MTESKHFSMYPHTVIGFSDGFMRAFNKAFSYNTVVIDLNDEQIDDLLVYRRCPNCDGKHFYNDCWVKKDLKVSFFRTCHHCNTMFILSGRYSKEEAFHNAFNFFKRRIYDCGKRVEKGETQ